MVHEFAFGGSHVSQPKKADDISLAAREMIRKYPADAGPRAETLYDALLESGQIDRAVRRRQIRKAIQLLQAAAGCGNRIHHTLNTTPSRRLQMLPGLHGPYANRRAAEELYRHKVDIQVPVEGLGRRLSILYTWCCENVADGEWAEHGHSKANLGEAPTDYARFYFLREQSAEAFRLLWADPIVQGVRQAPAQRPIRGQTTDIGIGEFQGPLRP